jgi:ATP-binding cassette, subfamily B, multidrug efflux pump
VRTLRLFRRVLLYYREHTRTTLIGCLSTVAGAVVGLAAPGIVGRAVDALAANAPLSVLWRDGLLLVAVTAGAGFFLFIQRKLLVGVSRHLEHRLRVDLFSHLLRLPASFFMRERVGDLLTRAVSDVGAVRMAVGPAFMYALGTGTVLIVSTVLMARISVPLTAISLAILPLVAGATRYFGTRIHERWGKTQEEMSRYTTRLQEFLVGLRVLRAYNCEQAEAQAMAARTRAYVATNVRLIRVSAPFQPVLQVLIGFSFVAVLGLGGDAVRRGAISLGQFVEFNLYLGRLIWPMIAVGWVANLVQRGAASMSRIEELFRQAPLPELPSSAALPTSAEPAALEVRRLSFSYPDAQNVALADVSFAVRAGERLAIVGGVGSGKSTLLALIPRLLEPATGALSLDGADVRDIPLDRLRREVALVPQGSFLFSASVRDNIALACPAARDDEIAAAAAAAGLAADLERLPSGLATVVGERGVTLSGGQRQRVAIARALLARPRLLLLDDCLSAVDTQTEQLILAALPRTTLLFATHRLAAAELCDQVIVLEQGRIVEAGTPADLAARGGRYARLLALQRLEQEERLEQTA